jgi:hypothetical protein
MHTTQPTGAPAHRQAAHGSAASDSRIATALVTLRLNTFGVTSPRTSVQLDGAEASVLLLDTPVMTTAAHVLESVQADRQACTLAALVEVRE